MTLVSESECLWKFKVDLGSACRIRTPHQGGLHEPLSRWSRQTCNSPACAACRRLRAGWLHVGIRSLEKARNCQCVARRRCSRQRTSSLSNTLSSFRRASSGREALSAAEAGGGSPSQCGVNGTTPNWAGKGVPKRCRCIAHARRGVIRPAIERRDNGLEAHPETRRTSRGTR